MSRMLKIWTVALSLTLGIAALAAPLGCEAQTPPSARKQIYPENADPKAAIAAGLAQAKREHKRLLIDFGGDWCGDCIVLDIYFHQPANMALLQKNFVLVHVFIKETMDNNIELGAKYGVDIAKGVPALSVVDSDGHIIYSQRTGQFNDMRHMDPGSVNEFLNRWKG